MHEQQELTRRQALLLTAGAGLLPAAAATAATTTAVPSGVPTLHLAYEAVVTLSADVVHGRTPYGERTRAPITGGWFRGPRIAGKIVPGGADWQLVRTDGYLMVDAGYFMEEEDGTQIHVRNRGLWHSPTNDWPADYALSTPEFEAPIGKHDWLNKHVFVGTIGPGPEGVSAVTLRIWQVLMPAR